MGMHEYAWERIGAHVGMHGRALVQINTPAGKRPILVCSLASQAINPGTSSPVLNL